MIRAVGRLAHAKTRLARFQPRLLAVAGTAILLIVSTGCNSTNEYPIDFFSEMHYSYSWHAEEPPRIDSPSTAIQVNQDMQNKLAYGPMVQIGAAEPTDYTIDELKNVPNPLEANDANLQAGAALFAINCAQCHGQKGQGLDTPQDEIGKGNGFMLNYFNPDTDQLPKDLTKDPVASLSDGEIYYYLSNGIEKMPPFKGILTPEQRWQLILHIRQIEGK